MGTNHQKGQKKGKIENTWNKLYNFLDQDHSVLHTMLPTSPAWPLPALLLSTAIFGSSVSAYFADELSTSPVRQFFLGKLAFKPIQLFSQVDLQGIGEQEA